MSELLILAVVYVGRDLNIHLLKQMVRVLAYSLPEYIQYIVI